MGYFGDDRHEQLGAQVRAFAEDVVAPQVAAMESRQRVDLEVPRQIARQGWIGVTIPRRYGSMELGHVAKTVIIE
ncbi:MAG: acyl-CoA dehydrogenase family protein, partial [Streptomycetales bacterium]